MSFCIVLVIFLSLCMCAYILVCMRVCMGKCVCVCVCVCICMRVPVHMEARGPLQVLFLTVYLAHLKSLTALGCLANHNHQSPVSTSSVLRCCNSCHAHLVSLGAGS